MKIFGKRKLPEGQGGGRVGKEGQLRETAVKCFYDYFFVVSNTTENIVVFDVAGVAAVVLIQVRKKGRSSEEIGKLRVFSLIQTWEWE